MAEYYCKEHDTVFFKKGKMKGYAHPVGDMGAWCNMPEGQEPMTEGEKEKVEAEKPLLKPSGEEVGMWYKELGGMIRAKDIDLTTPHGKLLRKAYYAKMFQVLNIKIETKEE